MQGHPALVLNADFRPLSYFPLSLMPCGMSTRTRSPRGEDRRTFELSALHQFFVARRSSLDPSCGRVDGAAVKAAPGPTWRRMSER
jgi:hypothetical protein